MERKFKNGGNGNLLGMLRLLLFLDCDWFLEEGNWEDVLLTVSLPFASLNPI